jgi:hypothetical protein
LFLPFSSINFENITFIITSIIDIIAITIIAITIIQIIIYFFKYNVKSPVISSSNSDSTNIKKIFISGLLLALEFEAANAILKMGVYTSLAIDKSVLSSSTISDDFINNFIIFIMILSIRIAINQSLRRFGDRND